MTSYIAKIKAFRCKKLYQVKVAVYFNVIGSIATKKLFSSQFDLRKKLYFLSRLQNFISGSVARS